MNMLAKISCVPLAVARSAAALLLIATLSIGNTAVAQSVTFPSVAVGDVPAGPTISGWIYKPAGAGPFPAVILLHTCGGVDSHTEAWGKRLASWGYLTLVPDSFTPRDVKNACGSNAVTPFQRVADVAGALDFLAARPDVVKGRVAVVGHSHGGGTASWSVRKPYNLAARGLRGAVAYYPPCRAKLDVKVALPLLILIGEKDDWTPADDCKGMQATLHQPDLVEAVYYPTAFHHFDDNGRDRFVPCGRGKSCHIAYDSRATSDAEARTRKFLETVLR